MHEEIPDDTIYQGVNTFFEVLAKYKSKDEKFHILQNQKELKDIIQSYKAMQMELLEKIIKDKEEKEAQAAQVLLVETHPDGDKGKVLMADLPDIPIF